MALNFGNFIIKVAENGVKAGVFSREWASQQLTGYSESGKITDADRVIFDVAMTVYEAEQAKVLEEAKEQEDADNGKN